MLKQATLFGKIGDDGEQNQLLPTPNNLQSLSQATLDKHQLSDRQGPKTRTMTDHSTALRSDSATSRIYDDLPGKRYIRLIRLDKPHSRPLTNLAVSLFTFELEKAPEYDALSYTWGAAFDESNVDSDTKLPETNPEILCNNLLLPVTQNLLDALSVLSANIAYEDWLWIDAICINQANIQERSQQVLLMGEIYTSAEKVIIWLGPEREGFDDLIWAVTDFPQFLEDAGEDEDYFNVGHKRLLDKVYWQSIGIDPLPHFERLANFYYSCRWFRRAWIFQEVSLARKAVVICGSKSLDWDALLGIAAISSLQGWWVELGAYLSLSYNLTSDYKLFSLPSEVLLLKTLSSRIASGGLADEIISTQSLFNGVETEQQLSFVWLQHLLVVNHNMECQDKRDKIYSILGIAETKFLDPDRPLSYYIRPDYSLPWNEVCQNLGKAIIKNSRYLDVLSFAGIPQVENGAGLPSWCPNYCSVRTHDPVVLITIPSQFNASLCDSGSKQSNVEFVDDSLRVEGVQFDVIEEIQKFSLEEILKKSLGQELLGFCLTFPEYIHGVRRLEVLWRTLVLNRGSTKDTLPMISPATPDLERSFLSAIGGMISFYLSTNRQDSAKVIQTLASLSPQLEVNRELYATKVFRALAPLSHQLEVNRELYGSFDDRAVFIDFYRLMSVSMSTAVLCYKNHAAESFHKLASEIILDYETTAAPFVHLMATTGRGRRLFRTKGGLLGLARETIQNGDRVFIISNTHTPFLLRATTDPLSFRVVGDCYVHGFMNGEMLDDEWRIRDSIKPIRLI